MTGERVGVGMGDGGESGSGDGWQGRELEWGWVMGERVG